MADVLSALALLFEPSTFIMCFVGMLVGVILGAIPGLAAGLAITVMLPISFTMKSTQAFALLMSIWVGGCSGSFIGSILLGIPGTPSSLATTFDGYAMTKKGQATRALSIGTLSNFLGTAPSIIIAMIACPLIASVAVKMGPWEYFALSFMAITLVVSISKGNMVKGFIGAGMGLLLTQVGYAPISSTERFTFGSYYLASGFSMSCVMIGIFAGSLIIMNYAHGVNGPKSSFDGKLTGFKIEKGDFSSNIPNIIRSFLIGLGIGFLPGMGAALSNMVSYATAKNSSKHPEEFGTGIPDGIWAPEAAILCLLVEIFGIRWFPKLLDAPYHFLYPAILALCLLGVYIETFNIANIIMACFFIAVGLYMMYAGIPTTPFILSFVLGSQMENYFRKAISYGKGDWTLFFTRPVSCILLIVAVGSVFVPLIKEHLAKKKAAAAQ